MHLIQYVLTCCHYSDSEMPMMIMMTTVMMMKVMMAITMITMMTPLVLLSEGACEKCHHDRFQFCLASITASQMTNTHIHIYAVYI